MQMKKHLQDLYKLFSHDESLLRLLYYDNLNGLNDPLDVSRPNILDREDKWDIIKYHIKHTPTTDDLLDEKPICRLFFYPSTRTPQFGNYQVAAQSVNIDVIVHRSFNDVDFRLAWLCDHVNELLFNNRITGLGKVEARSGTEITSLPNNYIGYGLTFEFGSVN